MAERGPRETTDWGERREDYALRYVPAGYRRWSAISLTGVMLGVATAMFFLAWGGELALSYGTRNTLLGMVIGTVFIGGLATILARISSATGLDADLITRGAGFGFMGSAITSLIYSFNFLMFFAFEGTIMATAVHQRWPAIPLWALYLIIGVAFIPLTWWGMTVVNWVMWVSLPIYLVFLVWTIKLALDHGGAPGFWGYVPKAPTSPEAGPALLQVLAAVLALVSQATIAADVGRFIPGQRRTSGAFIVGFVSQLLTFVGVAMLGAWLTFSFGRESNPGTYLASLMGVWGVLFVVTTQLRINVTNVYSGSLAYANFFCRVFHVTPGRHWFVILTSALGTALMFGGIFEHLNAVLTFEGIFVMAWVMSITADILVNKPLGLVPRNFIFKRGQSRKWNPVGMVSMLVALVVAIPMAFGLFGPLGKTLAPFVSGVIAFALTPLMALLTKARWYQPETVAVNIDPALPAVGAGDARHLHFADTPESARTDCGVCGQRFELAEFARCPFHEVDICSVCCASESACADMCKSAPVIATAQSLSQPGAAR